MSGTSSAPTTRSHVSYCASCAALLLLLRAATSRKKSIRVASERLHSAMAAFTSALFHLKFHCAYNRDAPSPGISTIGSRCFFASETADSVSAQSEAATLNRSPCRATRDDDLVIFTLYYFTLLRLNSRFTLLHTRHLEGDHDQHKS